jgi:hypothetical protein
LDNSAPFALRKPNSESEISSFWSFAVVFSISTDAEPSRMSCQVKFLEGEDVGARSVAADWAGGAGLGGSAGAALRGSAAQTTSIQSGLSTFLICRFKAGPQLKGNNIVEDRQASRAVALSLRRRTSNRHLRRRSPERTPPPTAGTTLSLAPISEPLWLIASSSSRKAGQSLVSGPGKKLLSTRKRDRGERTSSTTSIWPRSTIVSMSGSIAPAYWNRQRPPGRITSNEILVGLSCGFFLANYIEEKTLGSFRAAVWPCGGDHIVSDRGFRERPRLSGQGIPAGIGRPGMIQQCAMYEETARTTAD